MVEVEIAQHEGRVGNDGKIRFGGTVLVLFERPLVL